MSSIGVPPPSSRVADYFLVVGTGKKLRPIDDAAQPKDAQVDGFLSSLPPPPRTYLDRLYRGEVLSRFPSTDHASVPFPDGISMFCIPDSISLTQSNTELPILYYFAATQGNGSRLYGACLKFFEQVPDESVRELIEQDLIAQQTLTNISDGPPTVVFHHESTTDSNERESNPLSRTHQQMNDEINIEMEHSLTQNDEHQEEISVTHKKSGRNSPSTPFPRRDSPTPVASQNLTSDLTAASSTVSPTGISSSPSASPDSAISASPPPPARPERGAISLESFATILSPSPPPPAPASVTMTHVSLSQAPSASSTSSAPVEPRPTKTVINIISPTPSSDSTSSPPPSGGATTLTRSLTGPSLASSPSFSAGSASSDLVAASPPPTKLKPVYAPKCLCILSLHPFLEQYRMFLTELYRISLTPTTIPIERFIANFMLEIPLPPLGELKYQYTISNQLLEFARNPPNNPLNYIHSSLKNRASRILTLFELLDLENILFILECILLEKRLLFLSCKLSLLCMVSEIFLHLLYPFQWPHVYIPLLPKALIDFLYAPMPFMIGMHHEYVRGHLHGEMLIDLVVIDLDKNKVHFSNNPHSLPSTFNPNKPTDSAIYQGHVHHFLPSKERKKLKLKLKPFQALFSRSTIGPSAVRPPHQAYQLRVLDELDLAFPNAAHPDELDSIQEYSTLLQELGAQEHEISLAFFRCFVSMFKEYRECLIFPTPSVPNPDPCFKLKEFLKRSGVSDDAAVGFYTAFAKTQAFQRFCEERIYAPSTPPTNTSSINNPNVSKELLAWYAIQFFDESILAKKNRSMFVSASKRHPTPFLNETKYEIKQVIQVPGPETCGLPDPVEVLASTVNCGTISATSSPSKSVNSLSVPTANKRMKPFTYSYTTFPDHLDESLFWGERLLPNGKTLEANLSNGKGSAGPSHGRKPSLFSTSPANVTSSINTTLNITGQPQPSIYDTDSQLILETIWLTLISTLSTSFHSHALLKLGLTHLDQRVHDVVAARAAVGEKWRAAPDLPQPPSEECFLRVMRACGACGQPQLATDIFQNMMLQLQEYSILKDSSSTQATAMYTFLLSIHSMNNDHKGLEGLMKLKKHTANAATSSAPKLPDKPHTAIKIDAPAPTTLQQQQSLSPIDVDFPESPNTTPGSQKTPAKTIPSTHSASGVDASHTSVGSSTVTKPPASPVTAGRSRSKTVGGLALHEVSFFLAQVKKIFPNLTIDLLDTCPNCDKHFTEIDIRHGWHPNKDSDYTTACPHCHGRFVAQFTIRPSGGDPTTFSADHPAIVCEYLPPIILRKEINHIIETSKSDAIPIGSSDFRQSQPTIFWNLIWQLTGLKYRVDFLIEPEKYHPKEPHVKKVLKQHHSLKRKSDKKPIQITTSKPTASPNLTAQASTTAPSPLPADVKSAAVPSTTQNTASTSSNTLAVPTTTHQDPSNSSTAPEPSSSEVHLDESTLDLALTDDQAAAEDVDEPSSSTTDSVSLTLSSTTTTEEDELAAELGESFTADLPLSPNTIGVEMSDSISPDSSTSTGLGSPDPIEIRSPAEIASSLHAALLADQRAASAAQGHEMNSTSSTSSTPAATSTTSSSTTV